MDINDLRGISTVFMLVSFVGLVIWAYSKKQKKSFDEAANLPFADNDINKRTISEVHNHE
ncbi:MAG: cbb3-type cytochrome c oxidase subunit 3 [Halieaceae bacterium]|jgi:cytochrome c oxidase cbb3-type subunit 4|nr:cbb3-type cytochrome c oxidase subunit 3 [Halieaceae bacterium]